MKVSKNLKIAVAAVLLSHSLLRLPLLAAYQSKLVDHHSMPTFLTLARLHGRTPQATHSHITLQIQVPVRRTKMQASSTLTSPILVMFLQRLQ